MSLIVGSSCPDFVLGQSFGAQQFHDWLGQGWGVVVALKAMSPTCSTEMLSLERIAHQYAAADIKLLGIALEDEASVEAWRSDLAEVWACPRTMPVFSDPAQHATQALDLRDPFAAAPALLRTVLVIGPDKRVVASQTYSINNGRNFHEILRNVRGMQLTHAQRVATGAAWSDGDPVMLPPSLSQSRAEEMYPGGVQVLRPYLRFVKAALMAAPPAATSAAAESAAAGGVS